ASPAKVALTALAKVPALMLERLTFASEATPFESVVVLPTAFPFSVKLIVAPLIGVLLEVSVAVNVAVLPEVPLREAEEMVVAGAPVHSPKRIDTSFEL